MGAILAGLVSSACGEASLAPLVGSYSPVNDRTTCGKLPLLGCGLTPPLDEKSEASLQHPPPEENAGYRNPTPPRCSGSASIHGSCRPATAEKACSGALVRGCPNGRSFARKGVKSLKGVPTDRRSNRRERPARTQPNLQAAPQRLARRTPRLSPAWASTASRADRPLNRVIVLVLRRSPAFLHPRSGGCSGASAPERDRKHQKS